MMLRERSRPNPTVQIPPWTLFDDPTATMLYSHCSPIMIEGLTPLQRYLPSNERMLDELNSGMESDPTVDEHTCDNFRMYEFKIRRCTRGRSHDWTECPFAHPGEKAKRRDPRKFHYSGMACPDFRKGSCKRGDECEFAHGVFECWLHPSRYRTQPCKDGTHCLRRVCFFAHTPDQIRILTLKVSDSYDGYSIRPKSSIASSPTSTLISPSFSPPSDSPPLSPNCPSIRLPVPVLSDSDVLAFSMRQLKLSKEKSSGAQFGYPRKWNLGPTGWMGIWEKGCLVQEETMERVESGRDLRAKIYEKLSRENLVEMVEKKTVAIAAPDIGWISELVK